MADDAIKRLFDVVADRKQHPFENSYTCYLFSEGLDKILKKCGEECAETIIAAKNGDSESTISEICDLFYHLIVLMAEMGISYEEVVRALDERAQKIGNLKQMKSTDKNS